MLLQNVSLTLNGKCSALITYYTSFVWTIINRLFVYAKGTSLGTTMRRLQASTTLVEREIWSISSDWPKTLVYWLFFARDPTYVQSGKW